MIWTYIRDFFVQYLFGGYASSGDAYAGLVGFNGYADQPIDAANFYYNVGGADYNDAFDHPVFISLGDWLSTTATIICMVLISICFILLIRWIFKAVTSAFLLK